MSRVDLKNRDGFTLIEVLIALVILGVAIVATIKLFPDSLRQARVATERTVVAHLADSLLSQVRASGAEELVRRQPAYLTATATATAAQIYRTGLLYTGYYGSVQPITGSDQTYLQRVTFSVRMPDDRLETFVTYVAKQ